MVKRILESTGSDLTKMTTQDLKQSIFSSEGRTIMAQSFGLGGLVWGVSNPEVEAAFGADMLLLNGYSLDPKSPLHGISHGGFTISNVEDRMSVRQLKELVRLPVGIYLECPGHYEQPEGMEHMLSGRIASEGNLIKVVEEGADFVILGGNPGMGASFKTILEAVRLTKQVAGDNLMIFGGKWEGQEERVLGDPLAPVDAKEYIAATIEAGADVISFPAPGSRTGITVDMIRELVEYTHLYKPGTLAMSFIDASVEGADVDTIRQIGLMTKATGADIHTLGDAGLVGCTIPENLFQLSITLKGKMKTYFRMASRNR